MASAKKSSKEEDQNKKDKKKTHKETPTKSKKSTKPIQQESKKSKNKTPNAKISSQQPNSKAEKRQRKEKDNDVGEDGLSFRFPMARIKRIMKTEDPDFALPADVVFLVNKATEMFLEKFCEDGYECSVRDRKKSLNYNHLASVVSKERRYDFLSDFVPEKVRAEDALSHRKLVENGQG